MGNEWRKDSDVIFERFAAGIDDAVSKGEELKCADRDLQYGIRLQNERLKKHGLWLRYNLTPRGYFTEGFSLGSMWNDGRYVNRMECRSCLKDEMYYEGQRAIFHKKQNAKLYQTVTDTTAPNDIADDEYICPDCGAPTKVGNLLNGCPSCGNRFKMSELYPKISNYYFYPDVGGTRSELAKVAVPTILITTAAVYTPMFLLGILGLIGSAILPNQNTYQAMQSMSSSVGILIGGLFPALFMGPVIGWIITSVIYMTRLGKFAAQRIPMAKYLGCQKQFEDFMKQFSPEFSYEFFAGKTVSMIKMLIFAENPAEMPFYNGPALDPALLNIVDVTSMGAVGIDRMEFVNGYAVIYSDVYLENTYHENGRIRRVNEVFEVVMRKNVSRPVNMRFMITAIHCPTCGGSFDATKNRTCPYCGNAYRMEDVDWSIEVMRRKSR